MNLEEWKAAVINNGRCLEDFHDAIIEECAQELEKLGARYCQGHDLPAAIRALKDKP